MSALNSIDLTLLGCPMHYLKARETLSKMDVDETVLFTVNKGDAVETVIEKLRENGQLCEISSTDALTEVIKVTKKYD